MHLEKKKYGIAMTVAGCLWLGLFPLLQFFTYQTITHDKWVCMLILSGITVVCFVIDALYHRICRPQLLPLICGGGLLLWISLSCVFSPYTNQTVWTDSPWIIGAGRREGLVSQLCYLGIFFFFSFSKIRLVPVKLSAGLGVVGFFIVAMLQRAGGNPLGLYPGSFNFANAPHFQGTIGHIDMCAGYLVMMVGIFLPALLGEVKDLVSFFRKNKSYYIRAKKNLRSDKILKKSILERKNNDKRKKISLAFLYVGFLLVVLSVCVYLLLTIDVHLGVLSLLVLLTWTFIRFFPSKLRLPIFLVLLVLFLALVWYWPGRPGPMWELHEILQGRPLFWFGSARVGVWTYSFTLLREEGHLLFGTGADTFAIRFNAFLDAYYEAHPEAEHLWEYFDTPHNDYLALAINCGIPALLFFLVLVVAGCFAAPAWRDGVLCYAVQVSLAFSVCIVAPMFWTILGLSFSMPSERKKATSSGKRIWKPKGKRLVIM